MRPKFIKSFLDELLLYSGQFALFYIIMQLIIQKGQFLLNVGHMSLVVSLLIQTFILSFRAEQSRKEIPFLFIVPLLYSLFELSEGTAYLLNTAHIGFWFFALIFSILRFIKFSGSGRTNRSVEFSYIFLNVFIFLFLYFYFDTWKEIQNSDQLTIVNIWSHLTSFLIDPTHWYIIFGGALLALIIGIGRYENFRLNEKIIQLFGKYVDENVRDTILEKGEYTSTKKYLCVLFSDIKNFTAYSEKNDAETVSKMLNIYFEYWDRIVSAHNGTIDKYIGDAIMVIFGLEKKHNACEDAISCALEVCESENILKGLLEESGLPVPEGFGVGCHYGELIVGDIGSTNRKNFTVIGDTVNVASRLESLSRKTKHKIIISMETFSQLNGELQRLFEKIGSIQLKGKSSQTTVWGEKII